MGIPLQALARGSWIRETMICTQISQIVLFRCRIAWCVCTTRALQTCSLTRSAPMARGGSLTSCPFWRWCVSFFYFVTSSDSGSMIVDMISANGFAEPPLPQRILWSGMEGLCAIALLLSGRNLPDSEGSLRALQSASLISGLPYTFILFWCAQSLYLLVLEEAGDISKDRKAFRTFIFELHEPSNMLIAAFAPGYHFGVIVSRIGGWPMSGVSTFASGVVWGVGVQLMYLWSWILLWCTLLTEVWSIVALTFFIGFGTAVGFLRTNVRDVHKIKHGDMLTDLLCGIFLPMFALTQMMDHMDKDVVIVAPPVPEKVTGPNPDGEVG